MNRTPRLVGLIGGMGPESSALYYTGINRLMQQRRGPHRNGRSLMYTVDFEDVLSAGRANDWARVAEIIAHAGRRLIEAGADIIAMTSVTAHRASEAVEALLGRPLLHIGDAVGQTMVQSGCRSIGLLGTLPVTSEDFLQRRLAAYGLTAHSPPSGVRAELHRLIIDEFTLGRFSDEAKTYVTSVTNDLRRQGCDAVLIACTELPLLIRPEEFEFPVFDAVQIHCQSIVDAALNQCAAVERA